MWNCLCSCISAYATTESSTMCKVMPKNLLKDAGLQLIETNQESFNWYFLILVTFLMVFALVISLGKWWFLFKFMYGIPKL